MKMDLKAFAESAAIFSGQQSKAAGLAALFRVVEREAFADGVKAGRTQSYAKDALALHDEYENPKVPKKPLRKPFSRPVAASSLVQVDDQPASSDAVPNPLEQPASDTAR